MLRHVDLTTSGKFRCEVSGEAPLFQTATHTNVLIVVGKFSPYCHVILNPNNPILISIIISKYKNKRNHIAHNECKIDKDIEYGEE